MVLLNPLGGINQLLGIKIIVLLGFTNLISLFLVWLSCRCRSMLIQKMKPDSLYSKFFNMHCTFWKIFVTSVVLHVITVLMVFGIPL